MNIRPGVKIISEQKGSGANVSKGDTVKVKLNGWLTHGDLIQDNYVTQVLIGGRILIPGIEYAIEGMQVGGVRKVKISPHLGYKNFGVKNIIPPNAVLIYEITVLELCTNT